MNDEMKNLTNALVEDILNLTDGEMFAEEIDRQKLVDLISTAFPAILAQYSSYKIADRIIEAVRDGSVLQ
jgi:hypothetical protein